MSVPSRPIVEADLHAFVDGQMDFERRAAFVQAMAADPELRAKIESWRRQNEALAAAFGSVLREPIPLRLMPTSLAKERGQAANLSETPRKEAVSTPVSPILAMSPARAIAIAFAAFVAGGATVVVLGGLSGFGPAPGVKPAEAVLISGTRPLALRAYEAHRTYATDLNHAVEIPASDETHLLKWIQHRLSMAVRIPDLRRLGWSLVGGRVLPGEVGPAAYLIYGNGVERLGLYVGRTNARQTDSYSVYDNGAGLGSVAYWVNEPVGYALTTNRDAAWLDRNGTALYQSIQAQARDAANAD